MIESHVKNVDVFAICLLAAHVCNRPLGPEPGDEQFPHPIVALLLVQIVEHTLSCPTVTLSQSVSL